MYNYYWIINAKLDNISQVIILYNLIFVTYQSELNNKTIAIGKEIVTPRNHFSMNIYHLFSLCFIFFMFLLYAEVLSSNESPSEIELIKKIGAKFINEAVTSSKNLDEVATKVGISIEELKRVCDALSIDIDFLAEPVSLKKMASKDFIPDVIIEYNGISPYILVVEKSSHKIFVLAYKNGESTLLDVFDCKTGKNRGDKKEEGDHKTPEGIYFLVGKHNRDQLLRLVGRNKAYEYGETAFVTDFPNDIDKLNKKNGYGIWLHGTDEPFFNTSSYDTRGCVVTTNETIKKLDTYIQLNKTPLIIVEKLNFFTQTDYKKYKKESLDMIENWRSAWKEKRIDDYMSYYSENFKDRGRNHAQYKDYKARIFRNYKINYIELDNIIMLKYNDSLVANFIQDYSASNMKSKNSKTLYFVKGNNSWEIITEKIRN